MRELIYSMGVSLDGFIAGPDGEIDWSAPDELGLVDEFRLFVSRVVLGEPR
jgi:dihydrofolate reductase